MGDVPTVPPPLFNHLQELVYLNHIPPSFVNSLHTGQLLIDESNGEEFIIRNERVWINVNAPLSDQHVDQVPCRIPASMNVVKARMQVKESRRSSPDRRFHGGIVGDKLAGHHVHGKMIYLNASPTGRGIFDTILKYGTTTRTEDNIQLRQAGNRVDDYGGNRTIYGTSYQTIQGYDAYDGSPGDVGLLYGHMTDGGPFYASIHLNKDFQKRVKQPNCLYRFRPELDSESFSHAVMVYGVGECESTLEPGKRERYWVGQNTWGPMPPLSSDLPSHHLMSGLFLMSGILLASHLVTLFYFRQN